ILIARLAQHLDQIAYLARCAQALRTLDQADRALGKFKSQPLDLHHGGILHAADTEEYLEVPRVLLPAVADKAGVHLRIDTLQWLQYGHIGREPIRTHAGDAAGVTLEVARAPKR